MHPRLRNLLRHGRNKLKTLLGGSERDSAKPILFDLKPVEIEADLDFLLIELPARYLPMMPNGLAYLYYILKKAEISFQILDLSIDFYHRFNKKRGNGVIVTDSGYEMPVDPWDNSNVSQWSRPEVLEYFTPQLTEIAQKIVASGAKAVGLSVHGVNRQVSNLFIKMLRKMAPDIVIVVGGYDCVYAKLGQWCIPDFDYMVVNEAELTLGPLLKALAKGGRPKDLVGIISKFDTPGRILEETPLLEDLDTIEFPKYEWTDPNIYITPIGYTLVPILSSRGCHWGKCNFCSECFVFRKRDPISVVDEIEYMVKKGFGVFHFNESDVNGDPNNLYAVCAEIIKRGLDIKLVGQLRIDKHNTAQYMKHLATAGFVHLRFGVDGWSDRTLKLQKKGYNMKMVHENLKNTFKAGIYITVNILLGVPGETEQDIDEFIDQIVYNKKYIGLVEGINTLILGHGSQYYYNPEDYNIHFRGDKEAIYKKHVDFIPPALWYSEEPYIDQDIRMKRVDRICLGLFDNGLNLGPFAENRLKDLKEGKADRNVKK